MWEDIREHNVPYNALHDRGYPSIGCAPCTRAVQPGEHERAGRWWWEHPETKECGLHVGQGGGVRMTADVSRTPALTCITFVAATINGARGLRIFIDHGSPRAVLLHESGSESGARAARSRAERQRDVDEPGKISRSSGVASFRSSSASSPGVIVGTWLPTYVNPGWMKFWTYHRRSATDPGSGRWVQVSDQGRRQGQPVFRRRPGRVLFGDDDFGTAPGGHAEQPGAS